MGVGVAVAETDTGAGAAEALVETADRSCLVREGRSWECSGGGR